MDKYAIIIAIISLGGFAIQQLLQIGDIPISWVLAKLTKEGKRVPAGMTYADLKKGVMTSLAFVIACIGTLTFPEIRTLEYADASLANVDGLVTALVLSAGTEGMNTLLKYFSYVKDGRRPVADEVEVTIG